MIHNIKKLLGFNQSQYIDLKLYNKSHSKGLRLVKIPYNKWWLGVAIFIFIVAVLTPFTNFILIPVSIWILKRFA